MTNLRSQREDWQDMNDVEQVRQFIIAKNATHDPHQWRDFLYEEWNELQEAFDKGDLIGVLDAICDLKYELNGLGIVLGMNVTGAFNEVHRSNMTKEPGDGTHKIRKTMGQYSPPMLSQFINLEHTDLLPAEILGWFMAREAEAAEAAKWTAEGVDLDA